MPRTPSLYHAQTARFPAKSPIVNRISEMAQNDSHVPPMVLGQFLPSLVVVILGGWVNAVMQCAIAWPGRGQVLQPVCWPVRWLVR